MSRQISELNNNINQSSAQLDDEYLAQKIEEGIKQFIQKQRLAQQQAELKRIRDAGKKANNVRRVSEVRDHIFGNPNAEISLIEYSDFECPFCKRFHPTAKRIVEEYNGKVNWVYRHFPLGFHNPLAQKEAEASECASELGGNEMFWEYADLIYERTNSNGKGLPTESLVPMAEEIGLDADKFAECLESGRHAERVQEDFREGSEIGITGTPGNVFLHNKTGKAVLKAGAYPFDALKLEIDQLLK
ncbi:MAG: DsbA family protein [SAR324 cluster bacterium]|nr:DsbA family protein [SAR324 cluster bacterium]MBL7034742.1 DsbA family protein [SAR324 cluster bacterium]